MWLSYERSEKLLSLMAETIGDARVSRLLFYAAREDNLVGNRRLYTDMKTQMRICRGKTLTLLLPPISKHGRSGVDVFSIRIQNLCKLTDFSLAVNRLPIVLGKGKEKQVGSPFSPSSGENSTTLSTTLLISRINRLNLPVIIF